MMSVVGIGLDLVELDRFTALYGSLDPAILDRCFTQAEQQDVGVGTDQLARLAVRFAAKEAILKVLGGLQDGIALTDISVAATLVGAPFVELSGGASLAANTRGISAWHISLAHTAHTAAAVAVALSEGSIKRN